MTVLAVWRAGTPLRPGLSDLPLQFGDGLLLQGNRSPTCRCCATSPT